LKQLGVEALEFSGKTRIAGISVLGKGTVGIILKGILKGANVAVKIRRTDARRRDMTHEADMLAKANTAKIGPKLLGVSRNVLAMQLIQGSRLGEWIVKKKPTRMQVRHLLADILLQAYRLDSMGLDHGELSRAPKNVIVGIRMRPWIVDFESASTVRRAKNVTSLVQYFMFGNISKNLPWLVRKRRSLLTTVRDYKEAHNERNFEAILTALQGV
jgi:putative serine/threonine protein kinase